MKLIAAALTIALTATSAVAAMVDKPSPNDVPTTIDHLREAVEGAGASVIARVDHSGAAKGVGMSLRPAQLLIFGNPKVGTPLMQRSLAMSVIVPLRVAAFEDADGQTHVVYENMADVASTYGVDPDDASVAKISAVLDMLTDRAIAE